MQHGIENRPINYKQLKPSDALAPYVEKVWIVDQPTAYASDECGGRVLPDGRVELMFHYGGSFAGYQRDADKNQSSFLAGQITEAFILKSDGQVGTIGVTFAPYGFASFSRRPASDATNQSPLATDLFGREALHVEEMVAHATSDVQRQRLVESFLTRRLRKAVDPHCRRAVTRIEMAGGNIRIDDLASELGTTVRTLERKFQQVVGLSPKLFARIMRAQRFAHLIRNSRGQQLTALSLEAGYYDQSHCIHEFGAIAGTSPQRYVAEGSTVGQNFLVANIQY